MGKKIKKLQQKGQPNPELAYRSISPAASRSLMTWNKKPHSEGKKDMIDIVNLLYQPYPKFPPRLCVWGGMCGREADGASIYCSHDNVRFLRSASVFLLMGTLLVSAGVLWGR